MLACDVADSKLLENADEVDERAASSKMHGRARSICFLGPEIRFQFLAPCTRDYKFRSGMAPFHRANSTCYDLGPKPP